MTNDTPIMIGIDLATGRDTMVADQLDAKGVLHIWTPCVGCLHRPSEHLFLMGPVRLCLDAGCSCGRRALMAMARRLVPFLPAAFAFGYLAYHLARWAATGFLVSRI